MSLSDLIKRILDALFRRAPKVPIPPHAPPWFVKATSYLGFHEKGVNLGIEHFISGAKCGSLRDPWCAIFANCCLEEAGIPGTRSAMARSFEHSLNFVQLAGPALGCIVTMWRGSPSAGTGHVFFYCGENDKGILALGGNQSDQVCKQYEPRNRVVGYFWPKTYPIPTIGKVLIADDGAGEGSET